MGKLVAGQEVAAVLVSIQESHNVKPDDSSIFKMPRVTAIVPNYNHAPFLRPRVDSVLGQSFTDLEVILLDDASQDESFEILKSYEVHPRVSLVIRNEANTGNPFRQWNKGVAAARGEYIWIAESDDVAGPALLERLVDTLDRNPSVGIAYCQSLSIDGDGRVTGSLVNWTADLDGSRWTADYVANGTEECRRYAVHKCIIPNASAVVFRKDAYHRAGGADESFRLSGDWMTWVKMLLVSDVAFIAEPMNYFRMHSRTVRASSARSAIALDEAIRIFVYIHERADVPVAVRHAVLDRLLDRWILWFTLAPFQLKTHLKAYHDLKRLDPWLYRRIAKRISTRAGRMLSLSR